jgi:hypothetical protein
MITQNMIKAIHEKKIVQLTFNSDEKGKITRLCIPFDIGPSNKFKDGLERFHFLDIDSPAGSHNLSILPITIISLELTSDNFDPSHYVKWTPNWFLKRNWGKYS